MKAKGNLFLVLFILQTGFFVDPVLAQGDAPEDLLTNVYVVPPNFMQLSGNSKILPTAKNILESEGISFGPGCSAIYSRALSQLIVQNTQEQMELVETFVESISNQVMRQIYVSVRFAETNSSIRSPNGKQGTEHSDSNKPDSGASNIKSRAKLLEALESRNLNEDEYRIFGPKLSTGLVVGLFSPHQLEIAFADYRKQKGMRLLEGKASGYLLPDKGFLLLKKKDRAIGVKAEMSRDEAAIGLGLFFRDAPEKNGKDYKVSQAGLVIWDGQTVALERKVSEGHFEVAFVSAEIHDAAGFPVNSREKSSPAKPPVQ